MNVELRKFILLYNAAISPGSTRVRRNRRCHSILKAELKKRISSISKTFGAYAILLFITFGKYSY